MAVGTATLDFGAAPGNTVAVVTVTGQAAIVSGSKVEAFFMGSTTADHTDGDHIVTASMCTVVCGNIVAGTGFDITAVADQQLIGQYTINWVWV